jgi:hypothetical protein
MDEEDVRRVARILAVDAAANAGLGLPLLIAPRRVAQVLALPDGAGGFYQRVLGGVLTGIAAALLVERRRATSGGPVGLGTGGAIVINALGGGSVALWLVSSQGRGMRGRGRVVLGVVAVGVLAIGIVEALGERRERARQPRR